MVAQARAFTHLSVSPIWTLPRHIHKALSQENMGCEMQFSQTDADLTSRQEAHDK